MRRALLFLLLAMAVAALVNPGNFGSIDTQRRLQVARWLRLGEPQVRPDDHGFGLINKWGVAQAWYGMGQSLVLAPFDWAVSATVAPVARRMGLDAARREQFVELAIAFLMQSLLAAGALWLTFEILVHLGFDGRAAMAGVLALLFGTSYLFYVQTAQENSLLLVMSLTALYGVLRFRGGGDWRWAALAGWACGLAVLTRLPSLLETAVFFGLAIALGCDWRRFLAGYGPPIVAALAIDRWYQWHRFGNVLHTYARELGEQLRHPDYPASWPFSYPFWKGFGGTLFSPDKSIFLFDPLLVLLAVLVIWKWRSVERQVRWVLASLAALLAMYTVLYARYYDFGGDVTWAHRFVAVQVELPALFAVPLLVTFGASVRLRYAAWVLVGGSVVLQAISTAMVPNVEIVQRENGLDGGVIVNRVVNVVDVARGQDGGPRFAGVPVEWRTFAYLPFQLRFRFPRMAGWALAGWCAILACLPLIVAATWKRNRDYHKDLWIAESSYKGRCF